MKNYVNVAFMAKTSFEIASLCLEHFRPVEFRLKDDSASHAGHFNGPLDVSHLSLYIISSFFDKQPLVKRQRAVNKVLQPFFDQGLQAVQLNIKTPQEAYGQ